VLNTADEQSQAAVPVVISERLWEQRLSRTPALSGQRIVVNGADAVVVGVLPKAFRGTILDWGGPPDVWIPLRSLTDVVPSFRQVDVWNNRNVRWLLTVGRPPKDVSEARVQAALDVVASRLAAAYPATNKAYGFRVLGSQQARFWPGVRQHSNQFALLLLAIATGTLGIACFNSGGVSLVQALSKRKETGLRLALGATRIRSASPLILESLILTGTGGVLSIPVTIWLLSLVRAFPLPFLVPISLDLTYDWRALVACASILAVAMPIGGLLSAWAATRAGAPAGMMDVLRSGAVTARRGTGCGILRQVMVAAQVGVTFALIIGAGLLGSSLAEMYRVDLGYRPQGVLAAQIDFSEGIDTEPNAVNNRFRNLLDRIRRMPELSHASLASELLPSLTRVNRRVSVCCAAAEHGEAAGLDVHSSVVSDGYFETIRMPLLSGRDFRPQDDQAAPLVAIVNRHAAVQLWGTEAVIGKRLQLQGEARPREVVGVAGDAKYHHLDETPIPYLFLPLSQSRARELVLHTSSGLPEAVTAMALRRELTAEDPRLQSVSINSFETHFAARLSQPRMASYLAGIVSMAGLLLSALGLYGLIAHDVQSQRREIGLRMALGADTAAILGLVIGRGVKVVAGGVVIGTILSLAATQLLQAQLFGVEGSTPLQYVVAVATVVWIGLLSAISPVRRALRVRPSELLRF
jgi:predicted permease